MKRIVLVAVAVLCLAALSSAQATAISVRVTVDGANTDTGAFTARQVSLLNRRLVDYNTTRVANGQGAISMGVFLRGFIVQALREEEVQAEAHEQAEACAALAALTPAQRTTALAGAPWNGRSPCR